MVIKTYIVLFAATSLYAFVLAVLKRKWDPDLTWVEVAIGIAICMGAPMWLARVGDISWQTYEAYTLIGFVVGGFPIAIGESIRTRRAANAAISKARSLGGQVHGDREDPLAE